jgi:hypothetical protein
MVATSCQTVSISRRRDVTGIEGGRSIRGTELRRRGTCRRGDLVGGECGIDGSPAADLRRHAKHRELLIHGAGRPGTSFSTVPGHGRLSSDARMVGRHLEAMQCRDAGLWPLPMVIGRSDR